MSNPDSQDNAPERVLFLSPNGPVFNKRSTNAAAGRVAPDIAGLGLINQLCEAFRLQVVLTKDWYKTYVHPASFLRQAGLNASFHADKQLPSASSDEAGIRQWLPQSYI